MYPTVTLPLTLVTVLLLAAGPAAAEISGDYLEARTADVWTGPCFANGEMGLAGKEAILAWRVRRGDWQGVPLAGLSVVAVVKTDATLGDPDSVFSDTRSLLLVDERASADQRRALAELARELAGGVLGEVVGVTASPIEADFGGAEGFARVRAGEVAELATRALDHHDRHCGNEIVFYPPLTELAAATPAATLSHAYRGGELGSKWSSPGKRSAFVGEFAR